MLYKNTSYMMESQYLSSRHYFERLRESHNLSKQYLGHMLYLYMFIDILNKCSHTCITHFLYPPAPSWLEQKQVWSRRFNLLLAACLPSFCFRICITSQRPQTSLISKFLGPPQDIESDFQVKHLDSDLKLIVLSIIWVSVLLQPTLT